MSVQAGEIDLAYDVSKDGLEIFAADDNFNIITAENCRPYFIYMDYENLDAEVRKALIQAIDKDSICEYLLGETTSSAVGPFSSKTPYTEGLTQTIFDVNACRATLEAAGYTDSDGNGYYDKDGVELTIDMQLYPRLSQETIAIEMQAEFKEAGINCSVTVNDNRSYLSAGTFELGMYCVATAPVADSQAFLESYVRTGATENYGNYSNAEVDALILELASEFDPEKRAAITRNAIQLVLDDNAYMFMGMVNLSMVSSSKASNFENAACEYYYINVDSCVNE